MISSPYTVSQLLAGSIELLLKRRIEGQQNHSKLIYIIYGYTDTIYKACWDQLRQAFGEGILLVSIDQLPETSRQEYPSGRHTVIYYRNAAHLPVLCFDNRGNFEGYGTSLGKVERIGNQVTGEVASCLLQWIIQEGLRAEDPRKRSLANYLHNRDHKEYLRVFQFLFDVVKPHMERVVDYFNALCSAPEITNRSLGEYLHLLGLFRDTSLFETFPVSNRAIIDNHALSQVGYWERETREHITTAHLDTNVQMTLLGVMADATRLPEARQTLELKDFRASLLTRPRRSTEKIVQMLIYKDLQRAYVSHEQDSEIHEGTTMGDEEDLQDLAQRVFELCRNGTEPTLFPTTSGGDDDLGSLAWECVSGASLSKDIRSIGLAMMKASASLIGTIPPSAHRQLPGVQELVLTFDDLTKPMRELGIGLGYFSTLVLPGIAPFLHAYVNLLIQAKSMGQDAFDNTYGKWIPQLFTIDLQHAKHTHFTHLVTPFHPLQLRWRQTYEKELIRHIEEACQHPDLLNEKFFDELANLSSYNIPGILTLGKDLENKLSSRNARIGESSPYPKHSTKRESLSYPSAISRNTLFSAYSPLLQGLQGLPSQLIRKIEQFFLIYPSAVDRAQISVICPIDIDIENALSHIFETLQQRYKNAGFFVRLFLPDTIEQAALPDSRRSRRRYDEDQGELRVRTRQHLFPRTEFVTLRQDLLKTAKGQRFLFGEMAGPTQHLFLLLDHLGVEIQPYEIPPEAKKHLDQYIMLQEQLTDLSTSVATSPKEKRTTTREGERLLDPLTVLFHQGQEIFDEDHQLWTRGLVDTRDTMSLLYYTLAARSQGHAGKIYRYVCNLSRSTAEELRIDTLVKTLHNLGIWVAIVDRAITRDFFRTAQAEDENTIMLIDFHKGVGPQRAYNVTISSIWTKRVRENVQIALEHIAQATRPGDHTFEHPFIAAAIMRQLQDISGGLALQLAASNANTKGLLGLLVTALEAAKRMKEVSSDNGMYAPQEDNSSVITYRAVIPLDDHNDWFERDEIRTDLLVVTFEVDTDTTNIVEAHALHAYFSLIECKFDESVVRASKGFEQLQETARRLYQLFDYKALDYPFRLRDLAEAIRSLAKMYRGGLPDTYLERLRTNEGDIHLHVDKDEIAYYLCLYQIGDHLEEVQDACTQHAYQLLSNKSNPFGGRVQHPQGERICLYQYGSGVGDTFDRLVSWLSEVYSQI